MASASASASTLSVPGPAVSTPVATVSVPAVTPSSVAVPGATLPTVSVPVVVLPTSSTIPIPVVPSSSSSSSSSSLLTSAIIPVPTVSSPQPSHTSDPDSSNQVNAAVVAPISIVAVFVVAYIIYKMYLMHKERKEAKIPPPPPRMPAIFERPQSVMYASPPVMSGGASAYRQSMRPISMLYAPGAGDSSSTLAKGTYTSGSGNSTPTQHGFSPDDSGRLSRAGIPPRPHSVASFSSNRHSVYGSTRRSTPYMNRMEIVLPQPLAPDAMATTPPPRYRSSMYGMPPNAEMRQRDPMILPPVTSTPPLRITRSQEDWVSRAHSNDDARSSSSTEQPHTSEPPPPPPKTSPPVPPPKDISNRISQVYIASPPSPKTRERSVSPPEPLLPATVFVGSTSGSGRSSVANDSDPEQPRVTTK
ncbi:hypothetical protein FRC18_001518 [Serendipita sp. 400]|nr:hypothetical protein FRC18_001518 [Serendipita sp. 400]